MESLPISVPAADRNPTADIVDRAAEWLAHLESGDADDHDVAAFEDWRAAHPSHATAIERMGGLGDRLLHSDPVARATLKRLFLRPRRHLGGATVAVVGLVGLSLCIARLPAIQLQFADERTAAGEMRALPLADGSRITLASDSAVDLDVGRSHRTVRLLRGELLARVAKGQSASFIVETTDGSAMALGTAYTVRKYEGGTIVAVVESHVRACPPAAGRTGCTTLGPGERARLANGSVTRLLRIDPNDAAAWTDGCLTASEEPLGDVLDTLNRWRDTPIRFDRQSLGELRVSGIFPLRDTDSALTNLSRSQPIAIDQSDPASPLVTRVRP